MSIQALREQRAAIGKELQDLINKASWNAETDQPVYDEKLRVVDEIDAKINRINTVNEKLAEDTRRDYLADAADKLGTDTRNDGLKLWSKWVRRGDNALTADDWAQVRAARNAMGTEVGSEGGFTVASEVAGQVLEALKEYGGMREAADVIATESGASISFPTSDGTAEEGEIVPENQIATDADLTFGTIALPVYKFSSKVVTVPVELLQDAAFDVEAMVNRRLVERLGRVTNRLFTTGTGVGQPQGIQVAAGVGYTAANSTSQVTTVTYDSLVELEHSIDPAYRRMGGVGWMMNDASVKKVRQVKDGSSRPIFVPGYESNSPGGAPDMLLGRRIYINQSLPDMAATAKAILFGDFKKYIIRDVMSFAAFRFTDSAYAKKGQVGFMAWMRCGGALVDVGGAVKAFKNAAT